MTILIDYVLAISLVALGLTLYDKHASQKKKWRIKESTLLLVGFLGGALMMLVTMRLIRHKTRHAKFMISLPIMILIHGILLYLLVEKNVLILSALF